MKTIALILAGGSGTRLWPLSRRNMPKQLLSLIGDKTLLQETCQRLFFFIPPQDQWVITGMEHYQQVREQVQAIHGSIQVLEEPEAKIRLRLFFGQPGAARSSMVTMRYY